MNLLRKSLERSDIEDTKAEREKREIYEKIREPGN
jgi:hypothetical protein